MPFPTWLPPLQTNDGHSVHVTINQYQPPPTSPSSGFMIKVKVLITYVCEDPRISTVGLQGLSLVRSFYIPLNDLNISIPSWVTYSRARITNMLALVPVPFSTDRFYWRMSRLDGFVSSNILGDETDLDGFILRYLLDMRGPNVGSRSQSEVFAVALTIDKHAFILKDDFQNWIRWYDMQKMLSPTFEYDYAVAINRPWTFDAAFYEALTPRCVCPSVDNLMSGEEYQGRDLNEMCPICLERFELGSRVARLPCKHIYHGICIVESLSTSGLCLLCRSNFSLSLYFGSEVRQN